MLNSFPPLPPLQRPGSGGLVGDPSSVWKRPSKKDNTRGSVVSINQILHPQQGNAVGQQDTDEQIERDRVRYAKIRAIAQENREAKKADIRTKDKGDTYGIKVGTGSAFRKSGAGGIHKKLTHEFLKHKTTYGSLTSKEREVAEEVMTGTLSHKTTGAGISRYDRRKMKGKINTAHSSGDVGSIAHAKILKKLIDKLR